MTACKERWRNLRGCFTRHLKQKETSNSVRYRKPYYLADYMHFIYPFTKTRKSNSTFVKCEKTENIEDSTTNANTITIENELIQDETPVHEEEIQQEMQITTRDDSLIIPHTIEQQLNSTPVLLTEDLNRKRKYEPESISIQSTPLKIQGEPTFYELKSCNERSQEPDADLYFLKSLLPDIHSMNQYQKRKLRIHFLNVIDNILSEPNGNQNII